MDNPGHKYNFQAIGQAIKAARESKGWTREQVADMVDLAPRYIMSIENKGQHPSFQIFYKLITLFDISVDEYFYPGKAVEYSTRRRQLDTMLDGMNEKELFIIAGTAKAIREADKAGE